MKSRIMYVEFKGNNVTGPARIGRVTFSKTGKTLYYGGKRFIRASGYKWNCIDLETREHYWISGCRRDGVDRLYGESTLVEIDDDVREEYWTTIRKQPEKVTQNIANR
jgi:hypothetical protein